MRRIIAGSIVAAALAGLLLAGRLNTLSHTRVTGVPYVREFDGASAPIDKALALGDGQAFAAIARDPSLARPGAFRHGRANAAYRFGRPLFGELTWLLSGGRPGAVPSVMAVLCIGAVGAAAAGLALLMTRRGGNALFASATALLPGAWAATVGLTPEALALAFGAWAAALWSPRRRVSMPVVVLLCASVLTRETMLLLPIALAAWTLLRGHDADARRDVRRLVVPPAVALAAWYAFVRVRVGAWPFAGSPRGTFAAPFSGTVHSLAGWNGMDAIALLTAVVMAVFAIRGARRDALALVALAYVVLAPLMGPAVWRRWEDFGRPLLPLCAFGLVLLVAAAGHPAGSDISDVDAQVMSSMR